MVQVKKADVRAAITRAAFELFSRKGYTATTMADIARVSGSTVANLYVYFPSKLSLLYEIYRPWLTSELENLAAQVRSLRTPRTRLRRLFMGLWSDIPAADHCFANALIEALSCAPLGEQKPDNLLSWSEAFLTDLLRECLPARRQHLVADRLLANMFWMAFDGFAINRRIGDLRDIGRLADGLAALLLGGELDG